MYCTNCGQPRPDDSRACPSCGKPIRTFAQQAAAAVPNYLIQSILVTLCCCLPFGIVSIVYAAKVDSLLAAGDVAGAQLASKNARMWCWIAFGVGALASVIGLIASLLSNVRS